MIIYKATKKEFLDDWENERVIRKVSKSYEEKLGKSTYKESNSWNGSLPYLYLLLQDERIPADCGISLEHQIPNLDSEKRIDVMITGKDANKNNVAIILELKQWTTVKQPSDKIGFIEMYNSRIKDKRVHPAFQAWSYSHLLQRYNNAIVENNIQIYSCSFLHNYEIEENDSLYDEKYEEFLRRSPIFVRGELGKIRKFIYEKISYGDDCETIDLIDKSEVSICRLLEMVKIDFTKETEKVILIDEQELIYEKALQMAEQSAIDNKKRVLIVKGGPGTGKSVLAMKLLTDAIMSPENKIKEVNYVTPIQGQRKVYEYIMKKSENFKPIVRKLKGSGSFIDSKKNTYDILIVDEAHRLKEKTENLFKVRGENQTKEIIKASKFSIFFIDDRQRITIKDKGSIDEILRMAKNENAEIEQCELTSQFRCNGSAGYVSWVEDVLEIRNTANHDGFDTNLNYKIEVVDNPNKMRRFIEKKNIKNNASRIVAGYCWDSKKEARDDPEIHDIQIPKHKFSISWNLENENWAIAEDSVKRAGCVYTCQGLDFEYIGVIIGNDLIYRDGKVKVDYTKKAKTDSALRGIKKMMKENKEEAEKIADEIIKNTYRILLTRGQRGCIIYCEDEALGDYFRNRIDITKKISKNT